jgi:hypothetical protein
MKKRFALAALLAAAPFAVSAQALSYTYVEGGYDQTTMGKQHVDETEVDGAYVRGSVKISGSFHLFGRYAKLTGEESSVSLSGVHTYDTDFEMGELGLGYRHGLGDRLDLLTELSVLSRRIETMRTTRPIFGNLEPYTVTERDISTSSSKFSVGVRGSLTDQVEGWAKGGFISGDDPEGGFSATFGGQYKFGRTWGVVGELEAAESWTQFRLGVRASF